ncbi:MAG: hypothetical protein CVU36_05935 [Betaproteobacteria bacterium HGW-Betaproteobacteria-9]|nr:MAG: hypothetical protein CVU36_05935 [Betaproteobacteria bacterium HGW-Betaproteobacteria-9]
MAHPRRAARDPLKGAPLAAWQSQFRGGLGSDIFLRLGLWPVVVLDELLHLSGRSRKSGIQPGFIAL